MGKEHRVGIENEPHQIEKANFPIRELIGRIEDPENLGFANSTVTLTHLHFPFSLTDEYVVTIDKELDPLSLKKLIRSTTQRPGYMMPGITSLDWSLSQVKDLYEDALFDKKPVQPGHTFVDMASLRKSVTTVLNAEIDASGEEPLDPKAWVGKEMGRFYSLDAVKDDLLNQESYDGLQLRQILYSSLDPLTYFKLLQAYNFVPQYEVRSRNERRLKIYPRGGKIISAMRDNPDIMRNFLSGLSDEEMTRLTTQYAFINNGGYIDADQDGQQMIVFGIGARQQIPALDQAPVHFNRGNLSISGRLVAVPTDLGDGYTVSIDNARIRESLVPLLHWRTVPNYLRREWDLSPLTPEQLQETINATYLQSNGKLSPSSKLNPVIGMLTAFRYLQPLDEDFDPYAISRKPHSPAHTIATVALQQRNFLNHPFISSVENYFPK